MVAKKKTHDYESAISRLEEITDKLETGDAKLEEAISLYTEGLQIAKFCDQKLGEAEKKIKIITEKNELFEERDYDAGDDDS